MAFSVIRLYLDKEYLETKEAKVSTSELLVLLRSPPLRIPGVLLEVCLYGHDGRGQLLGDQGRFALSTAQVDHVLNHRRRLDIRNRQL